MFLLAEAADYVTEGAKIAAGGLTTAAVLWRYIAHLTETNKQQLLQLEQKERALTEALQARIDDYKDASRREQAALEHTVTAVTGTQHALQSIEEAVKGGKTDVLQNLQQCSVKLDSAKNGVELILHKMDQSPPTRSS